MVQGHKNGSRVEGLAIADMFACVLCSALGFFLAANGGAFAMLRVCRNNLTGIETAVHGQDIMIDRCGVLGSVVDTVPYKVGRRFDVGRRVRLCGCRWAAERIILSLLSDDPRRRDVGVHLWSRAVLAEHLEEEM